MANIDALPDIARLIYASSVSYPHLQTNIGDDDCAVIDVKDGCLVLTTDLMNHQPALMTLGLRDKYFNYGYLLASANISDLYGTGAYPIALLVGLLVPEAIEDKHIRRIMQGIQSCCAKHKVPVVGGDTKRSDRLQGYGVAIGSAKSIDHVFTRNNAQVGHSVCISGPVGDFNAATYLMSSSTCPQEWLADARKAILRPSLRRTLSLTLARRKLGRGGIDVSDGLGMDLWRLANASGVGLQINADSIPIGSLAQKTADREGIDPLAFVFATGGDWQFAFTCNRSDADACRLLGATPIGEVIDGNLSWLQQGNQRSPLPRFGHSDDHGLEFGEEVRLGVDRFSREKQRK